MTSSYFEQFSSHITKKLPWCQIINAPNLDLAQLAKIDPPHGLFINNGNLAGAGLSKDYLKWDDHEQGFQGGEEIVSGLITRTFRFCVIKRTPLVVESQGQILGNYFINGAISKHGILAKQNPMEFRKKSWWLIALLNPDNSILGESPLRLALSSATGAAFAQELRIENTETEKAFFRTQGLPEQQLDESAKMFCVHHWTLAPHKSAPTKAPFEVPIARYGVIEEKQSQLRMKGVRDRYTEVTPWKLEQGLLLPLSPTGQKLMEWKTEFGDSLDAKAKTLIESDSSTVEIEESDSEEFEVSEHDAVPF